MIADPPLKQVVAHTYEAGLRGKFSRADNKGQLTWSLGVFRTKSIDDIINIASAAIQGFGFFQNAGNTLRQGVEAKLNYKWDRWSAYANYTFVDAVYLTPLTISSPNDPFADANTARAVLWALPQLEILERYERRAFSRRRRAIREMYRSTL